MAIFIHVGCGTNRKDRTTRGFNTESWIEKRFDIDGSVQPDIVGTMIDMSSVASESADAVFSSHNIEHLYPHEVPLALKEFLRVLRPDGFLVLTCPDLKSVCALVAQGLATEPAYSLPTGGITPMDILFGHRQLLSQGNLHMAHRCGFTQKSLDDTLLASGFGAVGSISRGAPCFDLWVLASKPYRSQAQIEALAAQHFPN